MKLTTQIAPLADIAADWLIVAAWENEGVADAAELDRRLGGLLTGLRGRGDINGKAREPTVVPHGQAGVGAAGALGGIWAPGQDGCAGVVVRGSAAPRVPVTEGA